MRVALAALMLIGCGTSVAPIDAGPCTRLEPLASHTLAASDVTRTLALARGETDLGLVYVVRPTFPALAHFDFQRLGLDGAEIGSAVELNPIDMRGDGVVAVTYDHDAYVACSIAVGGASCWRVGAADAVTELPMVLDASAIAIASGPGGTMAAWIEAGSLQIGPLGGASTGAVATTESSPAIAAIDTGYVVGYTADTTAYAVRVDASGRADVPIALGSARPGSPIAVASASGVIGATYAAHDGGAMFATVQGMLVHETAMGSVVEGGTVSAAAGDGAFLATWSAGGSVFGELLWPDGTPTVGTPYVQPTSGGLLDGHGVVALDHGFALAYVAELPPAPVFVAILGCL